MQIDNISQRAQVNIFNLKFRPLVDGRGSSDEIYAGALKGRRGKF